MKTEMDIEKKVTTGQLRGTNASNVVKYLETSSATKGSNVNMSTFSMGKSNVSSNVPNRGKPGENVVSSGANRNPNVAPLLELKNIAKKF